MVVVNRPPIQHRAERWRRSSEKLIRGNQIRPPQQFVWFSLLDAQLPFLSHSDHSFAGSPGRSVMMIVWWSNSDAMPHSDSVRTPDFINIDLLLSSIPFTSTNSSTHYPTKPPTERPLALCFRPYMRVYRTIIYNAHSNPSVPRFVAFCPG